MMSESFRPKADKPHPNIATIVNKKYLSITILCMVILGLCVAALMLATSMLPNEKQDSELSEFRASDIKSGTYLEVRGPYYQAFILRTLDGELNLFSVPFDNGKYLLPDPDWRRPILPCDRFGPDSKDNNLVPGGEFRCQDIDSGNEFWWKADLRWTYKGESKYPPYEDMQSPKYEIVNELTVLK